MPAVVIVQHVSNGKVSLCPVGKAVPVGRGSESFVTCKDKHVSRHHCDLIGQADGRLKVVDKSTYGTYVGETKLSEGVAAPGDRIRLGHDYTLEVIGLLDPNAKPAPGADEPVPPQRMGAHYILLRELGRGGMGIVFETWDAQREQRCALKWLRGGGDADEEAVSRFKREVMLQGQLGDYPGIVSVYDLGVVTGSGEMFCVMEYVSGDTFLDKLRDGSLSREAGVRLIARVARAVGYAHARNVVHRDIKPANIIITADEQIRLTDFGIAKAMDETGRITLTGMMMGTPGYMAPEQITSSKEAGPPADIYALGALLFTFLTGKLPIRGKNLKDALNNARRGKYGPSPRELDPSIDPVLEAACRRALSYKEEDRWPTAEEFAEELERYLRETSSSGQVSLKAPE